LDKTLTNIPVSAVIATANRAAVFNKTLISLFSQSVVPQQIIVVDASDNDETYLQCKQNYPTIEWIKAKIKGAATQRNEGLELVQTDFVFFLDDDILFEADCMQNLWTAINSADDIGGVNAMITNQQYHTPGKVTRFMYQLMHGKKLDSYAGKCIGPAWNLLPEDKETLPEIVPVEWLNTTCTIYRKAALPRPVFSSHFTGYSLMEDVCLSLEVAKNWKLFNARTARIFHDSQPGVHKKNDFELAKMELVNRYYIMSKILGRTGFKNYIKLLLFQLFGIMTSANKFKLKVWLGKLGAVLTIAKGIHVK
jgi:glycosyltransferase involved in cell wall biosynthesis